jgi:urease accessory protein
MAWPAALQLHYHRERDRTVAGSRHEGPLRVLKALYPEGPAVCHHVLVHPPGGIAGGDTLALDLQLDAGSHALLTTPGATRFYRSAGEPAAQQVQAALAPGARLEWLPLETIAYDGCRAENRLRFELADGAEMIGRELLVLGLAASGAPFRRGSVRQTVDLPGAWLERGHTDAADARLLESPLGWAGRRVLGTLWFGAGTALAPARRDALLDAARAAVERAPALAAHAGATAPHGRVVVLRALAERAEPLMQLFDRVWAAWRERAWERAAAAPRIWRT